MYAERHAIALVTDASGDGTIYSSVPVTGRVLEMRYVPDGTSPLDTGADLVVTGETTATPIVTKANIGTSAFSLVPRQPTHKVADGAALVYAAAGEGVYEPVTIAQETIKVVVAQGGNVKRGTLYITIG